MSNSTKIIKTLVAVLALSAIVGCARMDSPSQQSRAASDAELAGAWYQIYFDTSSATVNPRGQLVIDNAANIAMNAGPTRVTVIGRTDRVGSAPDNLALAHQRANAVRDALIAAGVPSAEIDTSWSGESNQAVSTANDADEPRNRVVDVTVVQQPR
ncbi:MAG: OmpA family protein [Rhodovibrionaceae bacterium]